MGVKVDAGSNWPKTGKWLANLKDDFPPDKLLREYGRLGVESLKIYTPKKTGKTSESWDYDIVRDKKGVTLYWTNSNMVYSPVDNAYIEQRVSVAVLIQNGHATIRGNWVEGRDYITPALEPVIAKLNKELKREARAR